MSTLPQSSNDPTPLPIGVPANGHIVSTPDACFGKPHIAGTGIRVQDVVAWHLLAGESVDWIVENYPQLKRSDVHAALAYYYDHQAEIDAHIEAGRKAFEELKASQPSLLDRIRSRKNT